MTEVKLIAVGSTRATHHYSPNDVRCTKTLPSLAEVEERRLWNLRISASGVAGVDKGCSSVPCRSDVSVTRRMNR
jgi:hypothetical protein